MSHNHEGGVSQASQIVFLESKVEKLEAERDALAARVREMREAISKCRFDSLNMTFADLDYIKRAFATPDTSAESLARMKAAEVAHVWDDFGEKGDVIAKALRAKADELLKGLEKEHGN